jgi:hypothetical protein
MGLIIVEVSWKSIASWSLLENHKQVRPPMLEVLAGSNKTATQIKPALREATNRYMGKSF